MSNEIYFQNICSPIEPWQNPTPLFGAPEQKEQEQQEEPHQNLQSRSILKI